MKDADRLRRLFNYDDWSNRQILSCLDEIQTDEFNYTAKTKSLMSHLLAAQELWHRRIMGLEVQGFEIWPDFNREEMWEKSSTLYQFWQKLVDENKDKLDRMISYTNSSGTAYETGLSDILHHLIIHGQHHRAQIAVWLREGNIQPPPTDFIFYTRQNEM